MTPTSRTRWLCTALAVAGVGLGWNLARAHGGIGLPTLSITHPAAGEILELPGSPVAVRWVDGDPDDNANLALSLVQDAFTAPVALPIISGLPEDCDAADGGPVFTGVVDGGDPAALSRQQCGPVSSQCTALNDCYALSAGSTATGVYWVLGALDDDRGDGIPPDIVYAQSAGVVRVTAPGDNVPPVVLLLEPDGVGDVVDSCFHVRLHAQDPDDNAVVTVWLQRLDGAMEQVAVTTLQEDDGVTGVDVDLSTLPDVSQWNVWARVEDGHRPPLTVRAPGAITRLVGRGQDGGCSTPVVDAGPAGDAATPDAAAEDAGADVPDAGGGAQDAAMVLDAAAQDAAGTAQDAAVSVPDAAVPVADASSTPPAPVDPPARCSATHGVGTQTPVGALTCALLLAMVTRRRLAWRSMKLGCSG